MTDTTPGLRAPRTRAAAFKARLLLMASMMALPSVAAGCRPGGDVDASSSQFLIYTLDEDGEYRLEKRPITTLRDVRQVNGDVVEMRGAGELTPGVADPQTRAEWERALTIEGSQAPSIEYTVEEDGTVVPWDFDSAMMLTVYHHMEQSHQYFNAIPLDEEFRRQLGDEIGDLVGKIECYYYPSISIAGIKLPLFTDNAAYAFTLDAFLVPPRLALADAVPIYANRGVITHEYGHAVFNRIVHNDDRVPAPTLEGWAEDPETLRAYNELSGLDEGVADIWGALDTKDPDFIGASINVSLIDRDMAVTRYYETCIFEAVNTGTWPSAQACGGMYGANIESGVDSQGVRFDGEAGSPYGPHQLGAMVASVFWSLREQQGSKINDDAWGQIVAKALYAIQKPESDFRISSFFNALHDLLPAEAQPEACALFNERLIAIRSELQCNS